jgi:hypothetical protein
MIFRILSSLFLLGLATSITSAEPAPQIDTSAWAIYQNEKFGFSIKYPKFLHESSTTGKLNNAPIEKVNFMNKPTVDKQQEGIQLQVQRGINPKMLLIGDWYKDQMEKYKIEYSFESARIGGRPAVLRKFQTKFGQDYTFYTSLSKIDVLTINIIRPSSESQLDPVYQLILSTIKFLD